jgi:hypothetical protein
MKAFLAAMFGPSKAEMSRKWMEGERIAGVDLALNDTIRVRSGSHAGEFGAVISLLSLSPEPRYLIELASGRDVHLSQSVLEFQPNA